MGKRSASSALGEIAWNEWASKGVPVFPCSKTKRPCTPHGFKDAVTEYEAVIELFSRYSDAVYIGAVMGDVSGLFAIDVDSHKKDGDFAKYIEEWHNADLLPDTRIHNTPSGGVHLLYSSKRCPPSSKIGNAIDIKSNGGYIIVPPSEGYTTQTEIEPTVAPAALVRALEQITSANKLTTTEQLEAAILKADDFHDPLAMLAARRQANNEPAAKTMKYLLDLLEGSVARSPRHARHSRWADLMEDKGGELSRIVESGSRKYNPDRKTQRLREQYQLSKPTKTEKPEKKTSLQGFLGLFDHGYHVSETWDHSKNLKYVVDPLIVENDVIVLAADPKAGKTLWSLNLALHMATGTEFGTLRPVRETAEAASVPVVYYAMEGWSAVNERVKAWTIHNKHISYDEFTPLWVFDEAYNLTNPDKKEQMMEELIKFNARCMELGFGEVGLIIIDTLTKAMPGKDQNKVEDTAEVFEIIHMLRSIGLKCCVMYLHHTKKEGEEPRGSSNIMAEPDTILLLKKQTISVEGQLEHGSKLAVHRARNIPEDFTQDYMFVNVDIGENEQGINRTAAVFDVVETKAAVKSAEIALSEEKLKHTEKDFIYQLVYHTDLQYRSSEPISITKLSKDIKDTFPSKLSNFYDYEIMQAKKGRHARLEAWRRIAEISKKYDESLHLVFDADNETVATAITLDPTHSASG